MEIVEKFSAYSRNTGIKEMQENANKLDLLASKYGIRYYEAFADNVMKYENVQDAIDETWSELED